MRPYLNHLSPVTHPFFVNLAFKRNRAFRHYRGEQRYPTESYFALAGDVVTAFEQAAIATQNVRTASREGGRHVIDLNEPIEGTFEAFSSEVRSETHLATHVFQVTILCRTKRRPRARSDFRR